MVFLVTMFALKLEWCVCVSEPRQSGAESSLSVGEIFQVMSTSANDRDGVNGRDCSLAASAAPADVDIATVRLLRPFALRIIYH